jgi:hypothetical protein
LVEIYARIGDDALEAQFRAKNPSQLDLGPRAWAKIEQDSTLSSLTVFGPMGKRHVTRAGNEYFAVGTSGGSFFRESVTGGVLISRPHAPQPDSRVPLAPGFRKSVG